MAINNFKNNFNTPLQLKDVVVSGNVTGNVTGNITNTVTGTNTTEIVRGNMADNDQFRILIGGTASNSGYVEIATADDASEPIFVRQYTGPFTTLTRTATLLDGTGNTSFPGSLTVSGGTITAGNVAATLLSGNTTTNITMASGQTSGTLIFGGTSQTGAITLGQATVSQTLNLATGVSGVGASKTINVGTGGASGSFTQINIGPTAGLGTVVINSGTNLFVGSATSTGTSNQKLQVTGGAYVSGSVGIGTTNPQSVLDVFGGNVRSFGTAAPSFIATPTSGSSYIFGANTAITGGGIYDNTAAVWRLVVKDTTGNIGVGTTNPTSKLSVVGDTLITGIATVGLANTSTPPSNSQLSFELISDTQLRIKVRGTDGVLRSADITLS